MSDRVLPPQALLAAQSPGTLPAESVPLMLLDR